MYLFIFICILNFTPTNLYDSLISENMGISNKDVCVYSYVIEQDYFENVVFIETDTGCLITIPSDNPPFRYAVDKNQTLHRLFGFDSCNFNNLIDSNGFKLSKENVLDYGKYYLDICRLYDFFGYGYYFIDNLKNFVDLNRELMSDPIFPSNPDLKWEFVEKQLLCICEGLDFNKILWNESRQVFEIKYHVWIEGNGDLLEFCLEVSNNGKCNIISDIIVAKHLGFYRYIHR